VLPADPPWRENDFVMNDFVKILWLRFIVIHHGRRCRARFFVAIKP
jgi:hypothetical protein